MELKFTADEIKEIVLEKARSILPNCNDLTCEFFGATAYFNPSVQVIEALPFPALKGDMQNVFEPLVFPSIHK